MQWRIVAAFVALDVLLAMASPGTAAAQLAPRLMVSPSSGPVGTAARLQGSGLPPLVAVFLRYGQFVNGDQDCRDLRSGVPLPPAFTDESGSFSTVFLVPAPILQPEGGRTATAPGPACILGTSAPGLTVQAAYTITAPLGGATATCQFVLGFAALRDLIPGQVRTCVDNEQHNPANGDGLQLTTGGLLVWRKQDNWAAFTDGARTWVFGPYGLEQRWNSQQFAWEGPGSGAGPDLVAPEAADQLLHYYASIDQRDFAAAFNLWQAKPEPYATFVAGYATTLQVAVSTGRAQSHNAPGTLGLLLPAVILARQGDGRVVAFAGCYELDAPRPQPASPVGQPFRILTASIHAAPEIHGFHDRAAVQALTAPCP